MKIHLPLSLRAALTGVVTCSKNIFAALSVAFLCLPSQAESINLPYYTTWQSGSAPYYTGNDGDNYIQSLGEWNILSGSYTINAISLYGAELTNSGDVSVNSGAISCYQGGSIANKAGGEITVRSIGTEGIYNCFTLSNEALGTINATATGSDSQGISVTSSLQNSGTIYAAGTSYGLLVSGTLINSGQITGTTSLPDGDLTTSPRGIFFRSCTATNEAGGKIISDATMQIEGSVLNYGDIAIQSKNSHYTIGLSLYGEVRNESGGTISINAIRASGASSDSMYRACGIELDYACYAINCALINNGKVDIIVIDQGKSAYGIRKCGNYAGVFNETGGELSIDVTGAWACGIGSALRYNHGRISITATGGYSACGIEAANGWYDNKYIETYNQGDIEITAEGVQEAYGLRGNFINKTGGELISKASSANGTAIAIIASGTFINESGANITAVASSGIELPGYALGVQVYGTFFNAGTLKSDNVLVGDSAADAAFYILNGASAGAYTEDGTMQFSGAGTVYLGGERASDNTVSGLTSGSTITATSGISIYGSTLNLVDNVTLKMGGDLMVADGVTTTWNGNSLTIDNGGTRHSFSMGNEFAGSWSGSFTLRENESGEGFTLTQQKVDKYVSLNLGKVTVGGGVLQATETLELGNADTTMEITSDTDSIVLHGEHGGHVLNAVISAEGVMVSAGEGTQLTLDSSILTLGGGMNVLKNVIVQGSSYIGSELGSALSFDLVTFVLSELNSSLGAQAVLAIDDDVALFMTPYTSGGTAMLGTNILENVSVSGDMTLDLSYWADAIAEGGYDSLTFTLGDGVDIADGAQISATLDGVNYAMASYAADNMVQFNVASLTGAIPEPTTATLSLLALTMLAARRRRKSAA